MAQKKKNKKISSLPQVKKELKDFIADEQGKMTRKDVAKLGVSLAVLGMMMQPGSPQADTNIIKHNNHVDPGQPTPNCAAHTNVTSHASHSNHSDGSWGC